MSRHAHAVERCSMRTLHLTAMAAAVLSLLHGAPLAQTTSEQTDKAKEGKGAVQEVVITGNKQGGQSLQRTPSSVSAVSGDKLESLGVTSIQDIAATVPGLNAFNAGANQVKLKMRGLSSASQSEPQETVSIYLDEVSLTGSGGTNNENGASPDMGLFDLERIEVFKGPQGTLYGAGALGGTVRYVLNRPDLKRNSTRAQFRLSSTQGGGLSRGFDGVFNIPLVQDRLALRLAASKAHNAGWLDNRSARVGLGRTPTDRAQDNQNIDDSSLLRATLLAKATPELTVQARLMRREFDVLGQNSVDTTSQSDVRNWYVVPKNRDRINLADLLVEYDLGWGQLTSSTSVLQRTTNSLQDTTAAALFVFPTFFGLPADQVPAAPLYNDNKQKDKTQEFRLAFGRGKPLRGVIGLYYTEQDKFFTQDGPIPGVNDALTAAGNAFQVPTLPSVSGQIAGTHPSTYQATVPQVYTQSALFGELTWELDPRHEIILGGRQFRVKHDFSFRSGGLFSAAGATERQGSASESGFNPKLTYSFRPNADLNLYATAARGFRVGGFNQPVPQTPQCLSELQTLGLSNSDPAFKSDTVTSVEFGAKRKFADGTRLSGSVYHNDWKDVQVRKQLACGFTFFNNAGKAASQGAEVALETGIGDNLELSASLSYVDAKLKADITPIGRSGDRLPGVSDITASIGAEYRMLLGNHEFFLRSDLRHAGKFNSEFDATSAANRTGGNFTLVDLRFGLRHAGKGQWGATVFVNNLANKRATLGTQNNLFGDYRFVNRPRETGLIVSMAY